MSENTKNGKKRWLFPLLIIIGGALILFIMTISRRKPPTAPPMFNKGVLAEVIAAEVQSTNAVVRGFGNVKAQYEISLSAQVPGQVEWVSPDFVTGGVFSKNEPMLRIEQDDYLLAVEQAEAAVAQAEYGLAVAKANAEIAREEWETMQASNNRLNRSEDISKPNALVLHEPQLKQAEAALASARATLSGAELRLDRTEITAPFNCRIKWENADPGQFIATGVGIAGLYSIEMVEIEVALPIDELAWLDIPGAKAVVRLTLKDETYAWHGRVDRTVGVIDPALRQAKVVVQVRNPFEKRKAHSPELSIGTFVEVEIIGIKIDDVITLPRQALRNKHKIWIASNDSTLEVREVLVKRLTTSDVLISDGIMPGEYVVVSNISGAAPGLKLQPVMKDVAQQNGCK
ncbi:efflux RND transporter periplasmic adaptor subunit [bacterium]|nr:efflux RND transporter periplasmic adaptor subunit [bacterium]